MYTVLPNDSTQSQMPKQFGIDFENFCLYSLKSRQFI